MVFSSTLLLAAALLAQHPTGRPRPAPALSAEEVARLEAAHLTNIRQVTSGLARAGEGYFSPDGRSIIFQAVPQRSPSIFHHPLPDEDGYQIFLGPLEEDAPLRMVSTGQRAMHLPVLPSRAESRSCLHRPTSPPAPTPSRPRARPTAGQPAIAGSFPKRWTSSPPTSTGRT